MGLCWWFLGRSLELSWQVVDWSVEGGAPDHLAWVSMRVVDGDIFHLLHGSVLSMSRSVAAVAFRLVG